MSFVELQCELFLVLLCIMSNFWQSFITVQYESFLGVSLLLCNVRYVWQRNVTGENVLFVAVSFVTGQYVLFLAVLFVTGKYDICLAVYCY